MFKKILKALPLAVLLALLLVMPEAALRGASNGLMLWAKSVVPALLPFMLLCGFLEREPAFYRAGPLMLLMSGLLMGYPAAARLVGSVERDEKRGQRLLYGTNLASCGFIMSIIASSLYKNKMVFFVLFLGQLSAAAIVLAIVRLSCPKAVPALPREPEPMSFAKRFTASVESSAWGILKVGVCIVGCLVLTEILDGLGVCALASRLTGADEGLVFALMSGVLELTSGCSRAAELQLPLYAKMALSAFFLTFGGVSAGLQSACFTKLFSLWRYLGVKLLMRLAAAAVSRLLCPLFLPDAALAAMSLPNAANSLAMLGIAASFAVALLFTMFTGLLLFPKAVRQ